MHPTRISIPAKARAKLVVLLNQRLADAIDLQLQAKQAHWNLKGPSFIALHELFDRVHGAAAGSVDLLAERAVQLGGTAEGGVRTVAAESSLEPYPEGLVDGLAHAEALAGALAKAGAGIRKAIDAAGALGDQGTADIFTEVSRELDQYLWMVEAHRQET
jgi:starvation-inducible DNA-binding protein